MSDAVTVRHRFHRVNVGRHARDFLLYQIEIAQSFFELLTRVGVFDRQLQAMFGRAGATSSESGAPEIQNGQRDAQTFAERAKNIFFRHAHIV